MEFTVAKVASRVTAPTLVTAYAGDTLDIPAAQQGTELYELLRGPRRFHTFTEAEADDSRKQVH
jgi:hypothetical protein